MRKVFVMIVIGALFAACGGSDTGTPAENKESADNASNQPPAAEQAEYQKGLEMIGGSDCLTCHRINERINGPAYAEVAKKYEATDAVIDTLAHKIITGGSGVWGAAQMTPHPNLSLDSARTMVKYILSLRNQQGQ